MFKLKSMSLTTITQMMEFNLKLLMDSAITMDQYFITFLLL